MGQKHLRNANKLSIYASYFDKFFSLIGDALLEEILECRYGRFLTLTAVYNLIKNHTEESYN